MKSYSLMLVDDEEMARRHILQDISWNTLGIHPLYGACNGEEALERIPVLRPDIVILDIRMPRLDGPGLLGKLAGAAWKPRVIALSGYSDFEAARKMLSSGIVAEYLLKPASEDQLFEAVYKCIEIIEEKNASAATVQEFPEPAAAGGALRQEKPASTKIAMVSAVKKYIQEHYAEKINLSSAAELVHVNASYLSRIFPEVENMGFADFLCDVRMQRACELLMDYTLRVYEIAALVGYQDVKHFMKTFKRHEGMTPGEYREKHILDF